MGKIRLKMRENGNFEKHGCQYMVAIETAVKFSAPRNVIPNCCQIISGKHSQSFSDAPVTFQTRSPFDP